MTSKRAQELLDEVRSIYPPEPLDGALLVRMTDDEKENVMGVMSGTSLSVVGALEQIAQYGTE